MPNVATGTEIFVVIRSGKAGFLDVIHSGFDRKFAEAEFELAKRDRKRKGRSVVLARTVVDTLIASHGSEVIESNG